MLSYLKSGVCSHQKSSHRPSRLRQQTLLRGRVGHVDRHLLRPKSKTETPLLRFFRVFFVASCLGFLIKGCWFLIELYIITAWFVGSDSGSDLPVQIHRAIGSPNFCAKQRTDSQAFDPTLQGFTSWRSPTSTSKDWAFKTAMANKTLDPF